MNPILEAASGEGINNSDVDLFELDGNTYLFYATGDQATWGTVRVAMYPGPMKQFFQSCFSENTPTIKFSTRKEREKKTSESPCRKEKVVCMKAEIAP